MLLDVYCLFECYMLILLYEIDTNFNYFMLNLSLAKLYFIEMKC